MVMDAVITSVSGSLTHVIASIPVIGHEYPTHQHLGSVEPSYMIELASVDRALTGLSRSAEAIQGVRSLLQEQARKIRSIPDSWCLSIDTFITRLLGSYRETDYTLDQDNYQTDLVKRFSISRSMIQTVEGSPGVCQIVVEAQETNPYETEFLTPAEGSNNEDVEKVRKEVLEKLDRFGSSRHLNNIQNKLLLMNLGEQFGCRS